MFWISGRHQCQHSGTTRVSKQQQGVYWIVYCGCVYRFICLCSLLSPNGWITCNRENNVRHFGKKKSEKVHIWRLEWWMGQASSDQREEVCVLCETQSWYWPVLILVLKLCNVLNFCHLSNVSYMRSITSQNWFQPKPLKFFLNLIMWVCCCCCFCEYLFLLLYKHCFHTK